MLLFEASLSELRPSYFHFLKDDRASNLQDAYGIKMVSACSEIQVVVVFLACCLMPFSTVAQEIN